MQRIVDAHDDCSSEPFRQNRSRMLGSGHPGICTRKIFKTTTKESDPAIGDKSIEAIENKSLKTTRPRRNNDEFLIIRLKKVKCWIVGQTDICTFETEQREIRWRLKSDTSDDCFVNLTASTIGCRCDLNETGACWAKAKSSVRASLASFLFAKGIKDQHSRGRAVSSQSNTVMGSDIKQMWDIISPDRDHRHGKGQSVGRDLNLL